MIKFLSSVVTILFLSSSLFAQNACSKYYIFKEGTKFEMTAYDKKDKPTGIVKYHVLNVSGNSATLKNEIFDNKGNSVLSSEFGLICENDGVSIDFKSLMNNQIMEQYKEMNMEIDMSGTNIQIPNNLSPGQTLPDAELLLTMSMSSVSIKMEIKIINRKVIRNEMITTTAGDFNCVLITSDREMTMGRVTTMTSKQWLAEGIGMVKSEEYDQKGNLVSKSILTKLEK